MERLLEVMRRLRAPDGCPWDRAQTHQSLRPYLLEEAAEAVDAIGRGHPQEMAEELGDVLLQVAFHSVIAEQEGSFSYLEVEQHIVDKLIRRHPHVFGDARADTPEAVTANWNAIKAAEGKPAQSLCDQVPRSLGALARAAEIQKKLGTPYNGKAELIEAIQQGRLGEALWQMVAWCRQEKVNPEVLLREVCEERCSQEVGDG
ncbi:MAG: MazG family protein [Meiothermus sp.]|uniref:MazG family protein n=1 Tax=Meiothermus sp. TaxID=1955249 RepID=UPI0025EFED8D|nr:MazG family protein [Meiothermus sp.]MCS7068601.1 MazG family protein [Meiothermus sp.]MDW8425061.1 MazG family protein [Meiothermus sp.]